MPLLLLCVRAAFAAPPRITTPVTDVAGAVDAEDEERVASALKQLRDDGGPQMAVVFVQTTEGQPLEDYTMRIAEAWGGGSKELENGVVLLFAIGDRRSRLEVGYGLEAKIPDSQARKLLDQAKEDLRAERYGDRTGERFAPSTARTGRAWPGNRRKQIETSCRTHRKLRPPLEARSPAQPLLQA